ncbi:unnamed protein product [Cylicostephanus goldi]|uniref:Uncharacterized protein n=1 Tax=Cylicostephanus goldi TaxID=71465 RepID=A0A3P6QLC2_CYLGO|nr:unnamed protein product [Cylicostephanus goldi]
MDFRVRIIFVACACGYLHLASAVNSVEEIPPPLQVQKEGDSHTSPLDKKPSLQATSPLTATNSSSSNKSGAATAARKSTSQSKTSLELVKSTKPIVSTTKSTESDSAPKAAAPEFEDRNEQDEGGKGEEVCELLMEWWWLHELCLHASSLVLGFTLSKAVYHSHPYRCNPLEKAAVDTFLRLQVW